MKDLSSLGKIGGRAVVALLAFGVCMGTVQAASLVANPTAVNLNCGSTTATVNIKAISAPVGTASIAVSVGSAQAPLTVTAPTSQTLTSTTQTAGLNYVVGLQSGTSCATLSGTATITFKAGTTNDVVVTVNLGTQLTTTTPSVSVNCDPGGSSTTAQVVIKPLATLTSNSITVSTATLPTQVSVTGGPGTLNSSNQAAGLTFTIGFAGSGCAGIPSSVTVVFTANGSNDLPVTVNLGTVGFNVTPALLTLSCTLTGSSPNTYAPGPSQTVSVSATTLGSTTVPLAVDTTGAAWVSAGAPSGNAGPGAPATFTLSPAAGCGNFNAGTSHTGTVVVKDSAETTIAKSITVVLKVVLPSPLTFSPAAPSLTYVKGSGSAGKVSVSFTSANNPAPFFSINAATLPSWLTVDSISGNTPKNISFSSTSIADTLAPGTYNASIAIAVSGYADLSVPVSILITNKPASLSVAEGVTRNINWVQGTSLPTPFITAVSTDSPIPYTVTTAGTLQPTVSAAQQSGLAYSFGTQIGVSFNPVVFASAQPGQVLTGTVTLTWGKPVSTIVVTFNVTVQSAGATITSISPAGLPTANPGQTFQMTITGTGFVPVTDPTQKTKVGIVPSGSVTMQPDTNIAVNVLNASNMIITITVPSSADPNLPFAPGGTGGSVTLGICNPIGGTCSTPTATTTFTIGSNPIIQAVTSASSFMQTSPQTVAPYDMLSIFGTNFCSSGGTGCSSTQVLFGSPSAGTMQFPISLTPDVPGSTQRSLTVSFYQHGNSTLIANAPLLFATNAQINVVVPGAVSGNAQVDIVVNFGYGTGTTMKSSSAFPVNIAATNPGVFTIGQDGQGSAAVLDPNYAIVTSTNPGAMRAGTVGSNDSDTLAIYMTGLGMPDSVADNAQTGNYAWSTDCVDPSGFLASLNTAASTSLTTLDGVVIQSGLLNTGRFVPCILSNSADVPTVTIGNVAAPVKYAGWVPDTIAGLYQVNVQLPKTNPGSSFTTPTGASLSQIVAPVQLPVVVTANGKASQAGVTIWVAPRLKVDPPSSGGLTGTVGVLWPTSGNAVAASEGQSPYHYAVTSGVLPSGLSLNSSNGQISGTPAANTAGTYDLTVTATDSANVPLTGTTSFTLTVQGGLFVTTTSAGPFNYVFGTAHNSFTTVSATGGAFPYTYAITSPATVPTGLSLTGGALSVSNQLPAGTYPVSVKASDSATPAVQGTANFSIVEALNVANAGAPAATVSSGGSGTIITGLTTTGQTGTVTYSLDATTLALGWVSINSSTGQVTVTTAGSHASYPVTVTATDDTAATGSSAPATGTFTFSIVVN